MIKKVSNFIKKETVFCISLVVAVISMFIIPPSSSYIGYINFSVLALLFCLMSAIEGLKQSGIFSLTASALLKYAKDLRKLCFILITLCFFSSMLITNDVALIAFVPLTVMLMKDYKKDLLKTVALETVSANLGSMLTPLGNPQNLFIYEKSGMKPVEFLLTMLPVAIISFVMLSVSTLIVSKKPIEKPNTDIEFDRKGSIICGILFLMCILTVLHVIPYAICTAVIIVSLLIYRKKILMKVDYMLLLTFVCFFIFSGNLSAMPQIQQFFSDILKEHTLEASLLCSQVISNVPATVLLYPFCTDIKALLYGVDIGGLGTPVASLASLISYRIYITSEGAKGGKYLAVFMLICVIFLAVLYPSAKFIL